MKHKERLANFGSTKDKKMGAYTYRFTEIEQCNMCGSKPENYKILGKRLNKSQGSRPEKKSGITTTICKCDQCGLVFSDPQPIPDDISDHYGVPPESYWKEEYFNLDSDYFSHEIEILRELIDFQSQVGSLDIGAGIGKQMIALRQAGFDAYGLEPSSPFYERAISRMGISSDRLKLGMLEEVDYPDNFFDFISFGAVLEHLYDPSKSIKRALKWLKPSGIIHCEVPSSNWLINRLINFVYRIKLSDYVGNLSPMHTPYHLFEFSLKSFQLNAIENSYEIVHHEYYVCDTFMPKYLDGILKPFMKKNDTGMQLAIWLKKK